jgi:acyl-CoA thioesterase I
MTRGHGREKVGGVPQTDSAKPGQDPIEVACVGDSITRGTFVWRRKRHSYPAQLQAMLGERFCVRNFGVNGNAVQRSSDRSYWASGEFTSSSTSQPDIVLIMLGTNDSRGDNWKGVDSFRRDYRALAVHYRSLESKPAVWLLTPPAMFAVGRSAKVRYGMDLGAIQEMCGAIESLARDLGCGVVDIYGCTADHPEAFRFDGVHPGSAGATLIAHEVFVALSNAHATPQ